MWIWEWVIIDFIICGFEVYLFYEIVKNRCVKPTRNEKYILPALITMCIYWYIINQFHNLLINLVFVPIGLFLLGQFLYPNDEIKRKVWSACLFMVASILPEFIGGLTSKRLFHLEEYDPLSSFVLLIGEKMITFIVIKMLNRIRPKYEQTDKKTFRCFMILPISTILIIFGMLLISLHSDAVMNNRYWFIIGGLGLLVSNSLVFYMYEKHMEALDKAQKASLMRMKEEYDSKHYQLLAKSNETLKDLTHDFKNIIVTIGTLATKGECAKICTLVEKESEKIKDNNITYCDNITLNAVLCANQATAQNAGIEFIIDIQYGFDCNFIEDLDICKMIGNLLENAVEAAKKCKTNKFIKCKFLCDDKIVFEIKNSYVVGSIKDVNGKLLTSKEDKHSHGIGLKNVRDATENRYNGIFRYDHDLNGIFTATIVIDRDRVPIKI